MSVAAEQIEAAPSAGRWVLVSRVYGVARYQETPATRCTDFRENSAGVAPLATKYGPSGIYVQYREYESRTAVS